jgi:hypothetical protein
VLHQFVRKYRDLTGGFSKCRAEKTAFLGQMNYSDSTVISRSSQTAPQRESETGLRVEISVRTNCLLSEVGGDLQQT